MYCLWSVKMNGITGAVASTGGSGDVSLIQADVAATQAAVTSTQADVTVLEDFKNELSTGGVCAPPDYCVNQVFAKNVKTSNMNCGNLIPHFSGGTINVRGPLFYDAAVSVTSASSDSTLMDKKYVDEQTQANATTINLNTASIQANTTSLQYADVAITANLNSIQGNTSDIASNSTSVGVNTNIINNHTTDIQTNLNAIAANTANVNVYPFDLQQGEKSVPSELTGAVPTGALVPVLLNSSSTGLTSSGDSFQFTDSGGVPNDYSANESYSHTFDGGQTGKWEMTPNSFEFEYISLMYDRLGMQTSTDGVTFTNVSLPWMHKSVTVAPPWSRTKPSTAEPGWIFPGTMTIATNTYSMPTTTTFDARYIRFYFVSDSGTQKAGWDLELRFAATSTSGVFYSQIIAANTALLSTLYLSFAAGATGGVTTKVGVYRGSLESAGTIPTVSPVKIGGSSSSGKGVIQTFNLTPVGGQNLQVARGEKLVLAVEYIGTDKLLQKGGGVLDSRISGYEAGTVGTLPSSINFAREAVDIRLVVGVL